MRNLLRCGNLAELERNVGILSTPGGFKDARCGRGVLGQLRQGTPRTGNQLTAAIRTYAVQYRLRTGFAERAFKRANPGESGVGRQIPVAAFAVGSKLKHGFRCVMNLPSSGV